MFVELSPAEGFCSASVYMAIFSVLASSCLQQAVATSDLSGCTTGTLFSGFPLVPHSLDKENEVVIRAF